MELIPWLVAAYAVICVGAYFGNRLVMYLPDPTRFAPAEVGLESVEEIEIAVADGVALVAWYALAKEDKPTILYFHGNAANAANRAPKIETIRENGFGVIYLNNRGYGGSGGRPTEANNVADAIAAHDHLTGLGVPADRLLARYHGRRAHTADNVADVSAETSINTSRGVHCLSKTAQPQHFFWKGLLLPGGESHFELLRAEARHEGGRGRHR